MKYVITENNITVFLDNKPVIVDKSNEMFEEIKEAIIAGESDYQIRYLIDPSAVDNAKNILLDPLKSIYR